MLTLNEVYRISTKEDRAYWWAVHQTASRIDSRQAHCAFITQQEATASNQNVLPPGSLFIVKEIKKLHCKNSNDRPYYGIRVVGIMYGWIKVAAEWTAIPGFFEHVLDIQT